MTSGVNPINPSWPTNLESEPVEVRKNVIDHYQSMSTEVIKGMLQEKRGELIIIAENYCSDFNLATTIRNSNAFVVKEVRITGRRKWDRRGAVGTQNYETIKYYDSTEEAFEGLREEGYKIVVADNVDTAVDVRDYAWQPRTALVLGQEQLGVSETALQLADDIVYIPMLGSVRSLNVAVASGIMMYDYTSKVMPHGTAI